MSSRKTALVTGAAARIGAATVRILHGRGCDVMVHCNSKRAEADALAGELNALRPDSAHVAQADLSAQKGVDALAQACREAFPRLDILVNNASRFYPNEVGATPAWQWDDLISSNLRGPYFLVEALLPQLRTAGDSVINIVDIHADRPMPNHAVYNISKAGLAMMTRTLAWELGPAVRVNGVAPGAILWPEDGMSDAAQASILQQVPLGRPGEPGDIAGCVLYLLRDAPYVTGQIIAVDGGRSIGW